MATVINEELTKFKNSYSVTNYPERPKNSLHNFHIQE